MAAGHRRGVVWTSIIQVGALWGTSSPRPHINKHMPNDGDLVDLISLFMPDHALQRKVLVDNPYRLYGFTG